MPIKHPFVSGRDDGGDPGAVQPSGWNAEHQLSGMVAVVDQLPPAPNKVLATDEFANLKLIDSATLATLESPHFFGTPTAPTATLGTNTDQVATMAAVQAAINALIGGAPGALNVLAEIAAALGNDANFASTVTVALSNRLRIDTAQGLNGTQQAQGLANLGISGVVRDFLVTPSSANLRAALTDETGTGAAYFVGGALGTPASGVATNLTGLPLSGHAAQAPFTLVGNNTSGSAAPTAVDIAALTAKASPASTDLVMISDQAASGAWKKATVSSLIPAGSVTSYNGRTGVVWAAGNDIPLRSYLAGLTLSTAGSSTTFGISAGVATDSTGTSMMPLPAYTKTTAAWALGSGVGALDTGSIAANTWYHVHLIQRMDIGTVDVLISLSPTAPTMPANYYHFRRIGSIATNGSGQWAKFTQRGDEFLWEEPITNVNVSNLSTSPTLYGLSVPWGVSVEALIRVVFNHATASVGGLINSPDELLSGGVNSPPGNMNMVVPASNVAYATQMRVRTNTTCQIRATSTGASSTLIVATYGWIDGRGRNA